MKSYTIYCTEEQTKKALELGAPIGDGHYYDKICIIDNNDYAAPTTEQMIGWLEEQDGISSILVDKDQYEKYMYVLRGDKRKIINDAYGFPSRKEATIAAIDAALEYLSNNKK